jgi:hypothetical protein
MTNDDNRAVPFRLGVSSLDLDLMTYTKLTYKTRHNNTNTGNTKDMTKQPDTRTDIELLNDPTVLTVSIDVAARLLGVAKTTAHHHYTRTGHVVTGVPVLRSGRRVLVPTQALRKALGL